MQIIYTIMITLKIVLFYWLSHKVTDGKGNNYYNDYQITYQCLPVYDIGLVCSEGAVLKNMSI